MDNKLLKMEKLEHFKNFLPYTCPLLSVSLSILSLWWCVLAKKNKEKNLCIFCFNPFGCCCLCSFWAWLGLRRQRRRTTPPKAFICGFSNCKCQQPATSSQQSAAPAQSRQSLPIQADVHDLEFLLKIKIFLRSVLFLEFFVFFFFFYFHEIWRSLKLFFIFFFIFLNLSFFL